MDPLPTCSVDIGSCLRYIKTEFELIQKKVNASFFFFHVHDWGIKYVILINFQSDLSEFNFEGYNH